VSVRNQLRLLRCVRLLVAFTAAGLLGQQAMPRIEGENFAGQKVVIPDASRGHVAVLVFGFTKKSKDPTSEWAAKVTSDFGGQTGFELYQLPVLEDVPRFIRGMVISGIKKGVKENLRDHFVPIVQGEAELKKLVSYKEPDDAYLVVINPAGQILQQTHGPFSDILYQPLRSQLQAMLPH